MADRLIAERKQEALAHAAQTLLADYQTDSELTVFQDLNGEDFHAERGRLADKSRSKHRRRDS